MPDSLQWKEMAQWLLIPSGSIGLCVEPKLFSSCNIDSHQLISFYRFIYFSCFQSAQASQRFPENMKQYEEKKKPSIFSKTWPWLLVSTFFNKWHHRSFLYVKPGKNRVILRPPWWDPHHSWHGWSVCPRIVSPYPVRLKHSFKLQVFAVSLDNEVCVSAVCCLLQFQNDTQRLKKKNSHLFGTRWAHLWRVIFYHFFAEDPIWSNLLLTSICSVWFSAQVRWCTSHNQSDPFWHHPLMMDQPCFTPVSTQYPPALKVAPSPQRGSVLWSVG